MFQREYTGDIGWDLLNVQVATCQVDFPPVS
jgi:hypothetical protein